MEAVYIKKLLSEIATIMKEHREHLIDLDSVVGDGDLGLTMSDGFSAASDAIKDLNELDAGKLLYQAGKAMSTAVPSTMGTLMASGLMQAGKRLKGCTELSFLDIVDLFDAFEDGVKYRGKAVVGEKTFLDGLNPANKTLQESVKNDDELSIAVNKAYQASLEGYENTATMLAIHGRAATRGESSRTLKDPGAYVAVLIMEAFVQSIKESQ